MKSLKKLAGLILSVCLMVPMLGTVVFAADGVLMFSDPSTKVGENVSIDLVVQSGGDTIGDITVTMSYDTSVLEFISGAGFTADGSGTLTYTGTGSSSELRTTMTFRALTATDTTLSVSSSSASLSSGETLNLEEGSSAISIAAADDGTTSVAPTVTTTQTTSSTDIVVNVNGTDYNFSEAFTTADIPEGYTETSMIFNGEERKFVVNEAGIYLGYLVDDSGTGCFFLFNSEDATFAPYAELMISDTTSIIPLDKVDAVKLPENYQQSELTVQDQVFPVWSDPEISGRYYLIYALNTRTAQESLYQYDVEDGTYQYIEAPEQAEDADTQSALPGKIGQFISDHILPVLVAAAAICLLLLILMIVFAVKLVHRNQELDDLYDEYDIPFDDDDESPKKKSGKNTSVRSDEETDEFDDDIEYEYDDDEYEDDEYGDDEYDDEYEDDEYEDDEYEDDDFDNEYESGRKNRGGKKNSTSHSDDYDINFIDL